MGYDADKYFMDSLPSHVRSSNNFLQYICYIRKKEYGTWWKHFSLRYPYSNSYLKHITSLLLSGEHYSWIGYLIISLSFVAFLLIMKNNEDSRYPPVSVYELFNGGLLPEVSVIIPAYNEEFSIEYAIESMLNQTYPNTRIIVVNGSIDNTLKIISKYVDVNGDRVKLVRHEKNLGKFESLNSGMKETEKKHVYHMDADTVLAPGNIEKVLSSFNDERIDAET